MVRLPGNLVSGPVVCGHLTCRTAAETEDLLVFPFSDGEDDPVDDKGEQPVIIGAQLLNDAASVVPHDAPFPQLARPY